MQSGKIHFQVIEKWNKIDERKFGKNLGILINSPILVKNRQLDSFVQKMHIGHEKKNITHV